ncbi:unnamed protein product [Rhizophagus irregularis]|uniref:Uncharacterized protein n=1 Tax=Rhizophagus irregularis TaxID=588596 RepID=A0A916EI31_9GLOM|nr:unnamed protein product [Rhizophagus irregularis]CAB5187690.1 unnamed protein product [Rhizophagus irregularis]CAB5390142.1 unnamed protein product [Rhizophagus irregularis]
MDDKVNTDIKNGDPNFHYMLKRELLTGDHLLYELEEIVLLSIKYCYNWRKCEPLEQKVDGNMYMLEEIGERYQKHHQSYLPIHVSFLCILIKTKLNFGKSIVPICYEEQKKYFFDFVALLWDLKESLINTANMIK